MKFQLVLLFFALYTNCELILQNDFAKLLSFDKTIVDIKTFKFSKKSRTAATLDVEYATFNDIVSDEQMRIKVAALQFRGNEYKKTVVDFSLGICSLYNANKFDSLSLIKNSNLTGCPFPKGGYYISDVSPTTEFLPPFFPEGKWLLDLQFFSSEKLAVHVQWAFTVLKKI